MSERKYMRFVDVIGGWSVLQTVLEALAKACSIAKQVHESTL